MTGSTDASTTKADFKFYKNSMPYRLIQSIAVPTENFDCGMLINNKQTKKDKQDSHLFAAMIKSENATPCQIIKFTRNDSTENEWKQHPSASDSSSDDSNLVSSN